MLPCYMKMSQDELVSARLERELKLVYAHIRGRNNVHCLIVSQRKVKNQDFFNGWTMIS